MFSFITDRGWKAVWTAVTLASFAVMFALNFLLTGWFGLVVYDKDFSSGITVWRDYGLSV